MIHVATLIAAGIGVWAAGSLGVAFLYVAAREFFGRRAESRQR